jgi:DNA-binding transcriptional LysR family regulator
MDLDHLKVFIAVAESGSISRASSNVHMAPSTISSRITSLEEEFGEKLLTRQRKGAFLTDAGRRLLYYAICAVESMEAAKESMQKIENRNADGVFHIGITDSLIPSVLTKVSDILMRSTSWKLTSGSSLEICLLTQTSDIHMSLIHTAPTYDDCMQVTLLSQEEIKLIAPSIETSLPYKNLQTTLQKKPFLLLKRGMPLRELLENELFKPLRVFPEHYIELNSTQAIKELIAKGAGYSFLPLSSVDSDITNPPLSVIEVSELQMKQSSYCVYLKSMESKFGHQIAQIVDRLKRNDRNGHNQMIS